jgi:thiaminase/transcriptional activator TenA
MTSPGDSFSQQLRDEAGPIWRRIFAHPFLLEIRDGSLPLDKFRYYLAQDYQYLEGFARTVALALAKAPDSQTLELLARRVLTPVERPLHHQLLAVAGVSLEDVQQWGRSPTNTAYVNHMLTTGTLRGLGPTAAALLPCPWTYHLLGENLGPSQHPLYSQWTRFYMEGFLEQSVAAWRGFLDQAAAQASPQEREAMREAFLTSSRYEYLFWDMAYRQETWPV